METWLLKCLERKKLPQLKLCESIQRCIIRLLCFLFVFRLLFASSRLRCCLLTRIFVAINSISGLFSAAMLDILMFKRKKKHSRRLYERQLNFMVPIDTKKLSGVKDIAKFLRSFKRQVLSCVKESWC